MTELQPCPACRRHVASSETACPFCASAIAPSAPRVLPGGRLSRAAVFATTALAATACGGKTKEPPPPIVHDATAVAPMIDAQPADAAVDAAAIVVDAAMPDAPTPDAAVKKKPPPDARVPIAIPDHPNPKPYGAPPARRRIV